jgi:hypothetical protein
LNDDRVIVLVVLGLSLVSCLVGLYRGVHVYALLGLVLVVGGLFSYFTSRIMMALILAILSSLLALASLPSTIISVILIAQVLIVVVHDSKTMKPEDLAYYLSAIAYSVYAVVFITMLLRLFVSAYIVEGPSMAGLKTILYIASIPLLSSLSYRTASPWRLTSVRELLGPLLRVDARRVFCYTVYALTVYDVVLRPWLLPGLALGYVAMKVTVRIYGSKPELGLAAYTIAYAVYSFVNTLR